MLSRLQQLITLTLLAAAIACLLLNWAQRPALAIGGFVAICLTYVLVLGIEFVLLKLVGNGDKTLAPTRNELLRAWFGEAVVAPQVFCWRQPFRADQVPDHLRQPTVVKGRRGVVFVHGFFCNRGFWTPWLEVLTSSGNAFAAVNLEPVFGSIDDYVPLIDDAVKAVTLASGTAPILVCHSMGGLAARAWLRRSAPGSAYQIVTIGTPHGGTWLGHLSRARNGSEMRLSSGWLKRLAEEEGTLRHTPFTCWYSNCDNIVFPVATATLPGADNRLVRGVAHVQLAFHPVVVASTLAIISAM